jgi:hypothetical protein
MHLKLYVGLHGKVCTLCKYLLQVLGRIRDKIHDVSWVMDTGAYA